MLASCAGGLGHNARDRAFVPLRPSVTENRGSEGCVCAVVVTKKAPMM